MTATIFIPITHRAYAGGSRSVTVTAATLAEALARLEALFPELEGRIVDNGKKLVPGMEVAVNGRTVFPFTPEMAVEQGDEIRISSIVTGG